MTLASSAGVSGAAPSAYSEVLGEAAFLGRAAASPGVTRFARMLSEGYPFRAEVPEEPVGHVGRRRVRRLLGGEERPVGVAEQEGRRRRVERGHAPAPGRSAR